MQPEKQNQTQLYGQPQNLDQQIQQTQGPSPQQQIITMELKFQPKFNFRYLSYTVFALGITASITFLEFSEPGRHANDIWRLLS